MNRRKFVLLAGAASFLAAEPARADFVGDVRAQLLAQGYRKIAVSSTLLGRRRIVAQRSGGTREIILNPRTGEILRDLWSTGKGSSGPSIVGSGSADDDGDDDRDDDRDDDHDDDGDDGGRGRGRGRGGDDGDDSDSDGDGDEGRDSDSDGESDGDD